MSVSINLSSVFRVYYITCIMIIIIILVAFLIYVVILIIICVYMYDVVQHRRCVHVVKGITGSIMSDHEPGITKHESSPPHPTPPELTCLMPHRKQTQTIWWLYPAAAKRRC